MKSPLPGKVKKRDNFFICTFYTFVSIRYNEGKKKTEVAKMLFRKTEKHYVALNAREIHLARTALLWFRNKLLADGKPTEDVDELLLQIMR